MLFAADLKWGILTPMSKNVLPPLPLSPAAAALKPKVGKPKAQPETRAETPIPPGEISEEIGGPKCPEPTRFGDWERKGRCSDF